MGIDESRIKLTNTRFKGIIPNMEAEPLGKITLDVVFGTTKHNLKPLSFEVVPFKSGYHAVLARSAFA
jgi:hypothetical protein